MSFPSPCNGRLLMERRTDACGCFGQLFQRQTPPRFAVWPGVDRIGGFSLAEALRQHACDRMLAGAVIAQYLKNERLERNQGREHRSPSVRCVLDNVGNDSGRKKVIER